MDRSGRMARKPGTAPKPIRRPVPGQQGGQQPQQSDQQQQSVDAQARVHGTILYAVKFASIRFFSIIEQRYV